MNATQESIKYLDLIRRDRKMSIQALTEGIVSRRSYSRFLSNESELTFEVLSRLLERLQIPLFEFAMYVHNQHFYEHLDSILFYDLVRSENHQEAYDKYYEKLIKAPQELRYHKSASVALKIVEMKLNKTPKAEAMYTIRKMIDIDRIFKSKLVHVDDIESLYLFVKECKDVEKEAIADYFVRFIEQNNLKVISPTIEFTTMMVYLIVIRALTTQENVTPKILSQMRLVAKAAIEYHRRAKIAVYDYWLFELLMAFSKRLNRPNPILTFHYITSLMTSQDSQPLRHVQIELTEADLSAFDQCLDDEAFLRQPMYERVLADDLF